MPWNESAYRKVRCTSDTPFIRMSQSQQKTVDVVIRDESGDAVDLTQFEVVNPAQEYSSSSLAADVLEVKLAASHSLSSPGVVFELNATIVDAETGQVRFEFTPTETCAAGVYVASVGVFWAGILRHQQMFYLEFMPNNFAAGGTRILTVPEVRMDIADACPEANYLIDDLEFTDAEILHCMRKAVDAFNDTPPAVLRYNTNNFPFWDAWVSATVAYLLKMIWHRYARNVLEYSAAGVSVQDQRYQADTYMRQATAELDRYADWCQSTQVRANISAGYGSIAPSPYGRGYYGR